MHNLSNVPENAPCCSKPIAKSMLQSLFEIALFFPLGALILYCGKLAFDWTSTIGAIAALITGGVIAVYAHQFFPTIHGPRRG